MKNTDETQDAKENLKLTIPERLALLGVLPEQGSFADLKIIQGVKMELSFSEDEIKEWDIRNVLRFDFVAGDEKGKVTARDEFEAKKIMEKEFPGIEIKITPDTEFQSQIAWGKPGVPPETYVKEFDIKERGESIIKSAFKKFDREGKLTPHHISVYEKFIKE